MKLEWIGKHSGPQDTKELAVLIRKEGRLGKLVLFDLATGLRCAFGVTYNYSFDHIPKRILSFRSFNALRDAGFSYKANDNFVGTPEELCEHMAEDCGAVGCIR